MNLRNDHVSGNSAIQAVKHGPEVSAVAFAADAGVVTITQRQLYRPEHYKAFVRSPLYILRSVSYTAKPLSTAVIESCLSWQAMLTKITFVYDVSHL